MSAGPTVKLSSIVTASSANAVRRSSSESNMWRQSVRVSVVMGEAKAPPSAEKSASTAKGACERTAKRRAMRTASVNTRGRPCERRLPSNVGRVRNTVSNARSQASGRRSHGRRAISSSSATGVASTAASTT